MNLLPKIQIFFPRSIIFKHPHFQVDCPARCLYVRAILILIGMLTALQPFGSLNVHDQMAQIKGTIHVAAHLLLPLESLRESSEIMMVPAGFGQIEQWQAINKFYGSDLL